MRHRVANVDDLRRLAQRRLPRMLFDYIEGGAESESTVRANRAAFEQVRFRPRVLVDVSERSLRVSVAGETLDQPVILAPIGLAGVAAARAELSAARAAAAAGTVSVVSTASSVSLESVARAAERPQWFQLYPWGDRDAVTAMIGRAKTAGYSVMVVTVDVPVTGGRERDIRNGMTIPPRPSLASVLDLAVHPRWLARLAFGPPINFANLSETPNPQRRNVATLARRHASLINPGHTWSDFAWMRDLWDGKVFVKGITCAQDARLAVQHGCDGVIVSNHGGRQLDYVPATLQILPEVVDAVGAQTDVILDGGVRRGTDVVKAMALGAKAVMVGRPWLYGAAVQGTVGVTRVLDMLREETDRALTLLGCVDVAAVNADRLRVPRAFQCDGG